MKSVKEIIIEHKRRLYGNIDNETAIDELFKIVIGITEHLEAGAVVSIDGRPGPTAWIAVESKESIRREGMIAALLWRCDMCPDQGGPLCKGCRTSEALHRLEDGGDL